MCGIAGIASTELGARQDVETIRLMCNAIVHRGPDDEGFYLRNGVGLGMRRLSIIDLSGGHQPIHNEDRSVWVVFNGEIYNFPELRRELESRGHSFYTHSDTEVIVHLYEELGAECVRKLRGMFAIALWDERRKTLLLARDRLGKKPLHYAVRNGNLYFGSEIKSLLAVAPGLADVDHEAMLSYFQFGYIPDPLTAFRTIRKLPPGHLLEFEAGQIRVRSYWDLPSYGTSPTPPKSLIIGDQREIPCARFRAPADEAVAVVALPRRRAKQHGGQHATRTLPDQILCVLAYRAAVAQIMEFGQGGGQHFPPCGVAADLVDFQRPEFGQRGMERLAVPEARGDHLGPHAVGGSPTPRRQLNPPALVELHQQAARGHVP